MLFNSFDFLIFFLAAFSVYLVTLKNVRLQNRILLLANCIFYGWWDWRFLFLIFFTITVDFFIGRAIHLSQEEKTRKQFLLVSIISNLTVLGFFKYFNFFLGSIDNLFSFFGFSSNIPALNLILPVGISFYTFQSMSYVVDIYRKQLDPANNILDYAAYVSFFPQLVAGPIERGKHLLPQMLNPRKINIHSIYEGGYLIFWGLFKKIVVADNLALMVDPVFSSSGPYNGFQVLVAMYAFSFQIYCDFSAYSDIARGLGKCMGFDIVINFNLPYFSTNPTEFWRRWHISLSSWLRDYLYIPLGGNRKGAFKTYQNMAITMLLGGLWHGANWTFIIWGAYHGALLIVYRIITPYIEKLPKLTNPITRNVWFGLKVIFFFHLVALGWLFFRSQSLDQIVQMVHALFFGLNPTFDLFMIFVQFCFFISIPVMVQIFQYFRNDLMVILKQPGLIRGGFYLIILLVILVSGTKGGNEFIYFQF